MESAPAPRPERIPAPEIPPPPPRERTGTSLLERKALYRIQQEIAAMPASLVVQILLWPEKLTDWARDEGVTPALVYNMLGGFKPYHHLRQRLSHRLGVTKNALDHLIDGRRPPPASKRLPEPPADFPPAAERAELADRLPSPAATEHAPDAAKIGDADFPEQAGGPSGPSQPTHDDRQTSFGF